jgi:hypothetical protein
MKLYHINFNRSWYRWTSPVKTLPSHLPRLLLAERYQPRFVRHCDLAQSLIAPLQLLDWEQLPTTLAMQHSGERTIPLAAYVGAYLVKLDQSLPTFGALRTFLRRHPALVWALGFPLLPHAHRFDTDLSLPSQRHFSKKLSSLPNDILQTLLDGQVSWLREQLGSAVGQTVSIDTKHILAWVKENNPKVYIKEGRFDKLQQPAGDPDCKLGCKRRRNQVTPTKEGQPVSEKVSITGAMPLVSWPPNCLASASLSWLS